MRLRTPARHATTGAPARRDHAVALLATSTALLGMLTAVGAAAAEPEASPVVPIAAETAERPTAPERASRSRSLAGDDAGTAGTPSVAADPLPTCSTDVATGHANGQLPAAALCPLPDHAGHMLRPDAARGLVRLAAAYEEWFQAPLCMTDSYRSLGSQQALAARKPGLAARPGTSEHGWGLAADFGCGIEGYDTPQHRWMAAHAAEFGWGQPDWAKNGGAREEPWHWEYLAGS